MPAPLTYLCVGDSLQPLPHLRQRFAEQFTQGERYQMEKHEPRSLSSHNHYFAALNDAWSNLPDHLAAQFATPEHLRKFALIKAGYRDERTIVAASKAEAQRLAAFIRPMDDYAVVTAREAVVTVYTAKSQSMKAMGREDFQASKTAVLDVVAEMIGTTRDELASNAGKAA